MSERIRELTGGHKCEHGVQRATGSGKPYAGPVYRCECCRSPFGSLDPQGYGYPILCHGCSSEEQREINRLRKRISHLEIDVKMLLKELGRDG